MTDPSFSLDKIHFIISIQDSKDGFEVVRKEVLTGFNDPVYTNSSFLKARKVIMQIVQILSDNKTCKLTAFMNQGQNISASFTMTIDQSYIEKGK